MTMTNETKLTLSELIYLHRLFHGDMVRGRNELTRAIETMMEAAIKASERR